MFDGNLFVGGNLRGEVCGGRFVGIAIDLREFTGDRLRDGRRWTEGVFVEAEARDDGGAVGVA